MLTYKLQKDKYENVCSILRSDGWQIPVNPDNTDYQAYLKWLAVGNEPLPAENA